MNNVTAIANYEVQIAFVYFKLRLLHQYWHRTGRLNINQMADGLWTRQLGTIDNNMAVPSGVSGFGAQDIQLHMLFWAGCGTGYTASYAVLSWMWYRLYSFICCSELDVVQAIQLHTAVLSCMWYRLYSFIQLFSFSLNLITFKHFISTADKQRQMKF
jgi:hypothetical protein